MEQRGFFSVTEWSLSWLASPCPRTASRLVVMGWSEPSLKTSLPMLQKVHLNQQCLALKKFWINGVFKTIQWKIGIIGEGWQFARAAYLISFTVHPTSNRRWATTGLFYILALWQKVFKKLKWYKYFCANSIGVMCNAIVLAERCMLHL